MRARLTVLGWHLVDLATGRDVDVDCDHGHDHALPHSADLTVPLGFHPPSVLGDPATIPEHYE